MNDKNDKNEEYKNNLIKNINFKNISKDEQLKIINEIKDLNFDNVSEETLNNLKYTYENEINLIIKKKMDEFKNKLTGDWYNREKTMDDLIIFLLIIALIAVIIFKFSSIINDLIMFLLTKIILPHFIKLIILVFILIIYLYKKNLLYNIFDFLIIWFKILTFQWLF